MVARRILLKRGPNRSVLREEGHDALRAVDPGAVLVVKRYHGRGLSRFTDRSRARREKRVLDRLRELGLPAPRTGDVRREADGAWVLSMEWVGERTLASVLAESGGRMEPAVALALGELVATFLATGARHGDPHPGNIVLDAREMPWIVDARHIRFSSAPRRKIVLAQLAAMTATVRERLPARARARIFAEIWRRLPPVLRGDPALRTALVREIETRARALRRRTVLANLDRWTRESGVCVPADAHADEPRHVPAALALERRDGTRDLVRSGLLVVAGDEAGAAWRRSARLFEHGLPVIPPHRLESPPHPRASFELDARARPLDVAVGSLPPESLALLTRRIGRLLGAFHDRGLRLVLARGGDLMVSPNLEPLVSPVAHIDDLVRSASERLSEVALGPGMRELEAHSPLRRLLRDGYAEAFGEASERRAIRAELARG